MAKKNDWKETIAYMQSLREPGNEKERDRVNRKIQRDAKKLSDAGDPTGWFLAAIKI